MSRRGASILAAAAAALLWALGAEVLLNLAEDGHADGWWFVFLASPIPYLAVLAVVYGIAVERDGQGEWLHGWEAHRASADTPMERALEARRKRGAGLP